MILLHIKTNLWPSQKKDKMVIFSKISSIFGDIDSKTQTTQKYIVL